jgi:hypothetical protein
MMSNIFKVRADRDEVLVFYSQNTDTRWLTSNLVCSFVHTPIHSDFRLEGEGEYRRGIYLVPLKVENSQVVECTNEDVKKLGFEERQMGPNSWVFSRLLNNALYQYSKVNSDVSCSKINKACNIFFGNDELQGDYAKELVEKIRNVENDIPDKLMVFSPQIRVGFKVFHRAYLEGGNYYVFAVIEPVVTFSVKLDLETISSYVQDVGPGKTYFTYKPEDSKMASLVILEGISSENGKRVALFRDIEHGSEIKIEEEQWKYVKLNRVYSSFFYKTKLRELYEIENKLRDIRVRYFNNFRKNNVVKDNIGGINKKFYNNIALSGAKFKLTQHYLEFTTET